MFMGHGVFDRRENVPGCVKSSLQLRFRNLQDLAQLFQMIGGECLWVRESVRVVKPDPESRL